MTTDPRIAPLAEALFVVRLTAPQGYDRHAEWQRQGASITDVFTDEAAAILAALDGSGWRLHARDKMCPHEVELARLRAIEEAARALLAALTPYEREWVTAYTGYGLVGAAMPALRAALEADHA